MFYRYFKHEKGITGLETAIILIAFVVVAAVFAYTVLSAGLFSTQKGQEAVYSGLREAQSTLELKGSVIAIADQVGDDGSIKQISFVVSNVLGGEPIDFTQPSENTSTNNGQAATDSSNKVVINYIDKDHNIKNLFWTIDKMGDDDGDNLLEINEKFQVTVGSDNNTANGGNLTDALSTPLTVNTTFDLEIVAQAGAVLTIERTTPAYIDPIMNLH